MRLCSKAFLPSCKVNATSAKFCSGCSRRCVTNWSVARSSACRLLAESMISCQAWRVLMVSSPALPPKSHERWCRRSRMNLLLPVSAYCFPARAKACDSHGKDRARKESRGSPAGSSTMREWPMPKGQNGLNQSSHSGRRFRCPRLLLTDPTEMLEGLRPAWP